MTSVAILLSTYNGEKFLNEQIESILNQSYIDWTLYIRDDGSKDGTDQIINQYTNKYPNKIIRIESSKNIGVIRSFETLMKTCKEEYIFFCDQDDIWLPFKLKVSLEKLKELEKTNDSAISIFSDLTVVDEQLNVINPSFWKYSRINPDLLTSFDSLCVHAVATGCTLAINKKAKEIALDIPDEATMHDEWIVLSTIKANGIIEHIPFSTILYRQHKKNVIGATDDSNKTNYIISKFINLKKTIKENIYRWRMLKKLGFENPLKYIYLKLRYFLTYKPHI